MPVRVGDKPGPDGPDEETLLRAWDMRVKGDSNPKIAQAFGVSVSTAKRWVRQGQELAEAVSFTEQALDPMRTIDIRSEQQRQAATVDLVIGWMVDAVQGGRADETQAAVVVLKALERRAKALGTDAPTQAHLRVEGNGAAPEVSERAAEAVRRYREQQSERRVLTAAGEG